MNIFEALCITYDDSERYAKVISALGLNNVCECIPFTETEIKTAYKTDKNLNNLPLKKWDSAAGFNTGKYGEYCCYVGSKFTRLMKEKFNITSNVCSINVCILKEAARIKYCTE